MGNSLVIIPCSALRNADIHYLTRVSQWLFPLEVLVTCHKETTKLVNDKIAPLWVSPV